MNTTTTASATRIAGTDVTWPEPVAIAAERVLRGEPIARTLVLEESPTRQLGMWNITPGEFVTDHVGYIEYIHIVEGLGRLIGDDGATTELAPGVTVFTPAGWKGRWVVDETITKVFTVIYV